MEINDQGRGMKGGSSHRDRERRGGLLLLWSLAWSALALMMLVSYQPLLQTTRRSIDLSNTNVVSAPNLAEAGANEAIWYANRPLITMASNSYGCNAPWTQTCLNKGAPLVDFNNDAWITVFDVLAAAQAPFHGSHGWNPPVAPYSSTPTTKTVTLTDASGATVGSYQATVSNLDRPQPLVTSRSPSTGTAIRTTTVSLERVVSSFLYGAFGHYRTSLQGKVQIDSYNSGLGIYGATLGSSDATYGTLNQSQSTRQESWKSDIGTNSASTYNPDLSINHVAALVYGRAFVTPGTQTSTPTSPLTTYIKGDQFNQQTQRLPQQDSQRVVVPTSLSSLSVMLAPAAGWSGFSTYSGNGDFWCSGTCTCNSAVHIKSLYVTGTLDMQTGCQILIDKLDSTIPYKPGGAILDTDGSGKLSKSGSTDTTQIFLRDGYFSIDGGGLTTSVASPHPSAFQVFVTCTTAPCNNTTASGLAQRQPFHGVVYVEDGDLTLHRASENGTNYDGLYFGAFVAGRSLILTDDGTTKTVYLHYDEAVRDIPLNGTNSTNPNPFYRILSWDTR